MSLPMSSPVRRARWLLIALLVPFALAARTPRSEPATKADAGYTHYAVGDQAAKATAPVEPGLLLNGGGAWPQEAFRWFVAKAGHGHIVVLRASLAAEVQDEFFNDIGGIASAETFVFSDRRAAGDPVVLAAIAKADGIFIAGGDQSRYVRFWKGTPLAAALDRHVRDGKPIGGTSAGLAILGGWVYGAMTDGNLTSDKVLRDPLDGGVTLVDDFLHIDALRHVITDTHFSERQRLGRLIGFLSKLESQGVTGIAGLGIDESASLCVDGDGIGRIYLRGEAGRPDDGHAWLVQPSQAPTRFVAGSPLAASGIRITGIGRDSRIRFPDLRVERPAFNRIADVADGRLVLRDVDAKAASAGARFDRINPAMTGRAAEAGVHARTDARRGTIIADTATAP